MTAALMCDTCGRVISTRNKDGEAHGAEGWYTVDRNPLIVGPGYNEAQGALGMAAQALGEYGDDEDDPAGELPDVVFEPACHFCSIECLHAWARKPIESEP